MTSSYYERAESCIFLTGLTSVALGGMEMYNLGNYAIIDPLMKNLRARFPEAEVRTSLQLSDAFCERHGIASLRHPRFWTYGRRTAVATVLDIVRVFAWRALRPILRRRADRVLRGSRMLAELMRADVVLDFSGDLYGDNARPGRYLECSIRLLLARALGRPVVVMAGSPGPFTRAWRRAIAKLTLNRATRIVNREPMSTGVLRSLGIRESIVSTAACPSFLFDGHESIDVADVLTAEGIVAGAADDPVIGLIVSGWNMPKPPYNRAPREEAELRPFVSLVRMLTDEIGARVVLMSHAHRMNRDGTVIPGTDAAIMEQLHGLAVTPRNADRLHLVRGLYDASVMKALIGRLDMLVSGRIHGAVSGLSQAVPTVIIDYGHEPKAHKLRGFARLLGIDAYVCDPGDADDLTVKVRDAWSRRRSLREHLEVRLTDVRRRVMLNYEVIAEVLDGVAVRRDSRTVPAYGVARPS